MDVAAGPRMEPFTDFPPYHDARQCWNDLPWLKELAKGVPIYLKGVCTIDVSAIASTGRDSV